MKDKKKTIPRCPECDNAGMDCECDFKCPGCGEYGDYDEENYIRCINMDCRVRRYVAQ